MKATRLLNIFILSSSLVTMAACTEEEFVNESIVTTLRASIEQKADTKTHLSGPENNVYKTLWSEDDAIGVFAGSPNPSEFKLTGGAGTNSGEFTGTIPSGKKIAVYPYSICESINGSSISVTLPYEQFYKVGNIPDGAYPMVATSGENTLKFKNLCSVLKISMTGSLTVNHIRFSTNNSKIKVSGNATINSDPESPCLAVSEEGNSYVKLVCPAVPLSNSVTEFYIVVPAQKYTGGFTLIIDTDKGKVQKKIETDVTLKRSELYRITPFECRINEGDKNIIFEDANFKAYMVDNFDKDKDGEINYDEALSVTYIYVRTDSITSLVGIEHMPNLAHLRCLGSCEWNSLEGKNNYKGLLKSLDVTKNAKLKTLICDFNQLSTLDVTNNLLLETLWIQGNYFESIDISNNILLNEMVCNLNRITSIDVSNNTKLTHLDVSTNRLSSIDLSANTLLEYISLANNNHLSTIDVSRNHQLKEMYVYYCMLSSIDISNNPEITRLACGRNSISVIDISHNPALQMLSIYRNNLTKLDLTNNSKLVELDFQSNNLTSIELKNCPELKELNCADNNIKTLDISKLKALEKLYCNNNPLNTMYIFDGQIDGLKDKNIPSTTKFIVGSEPGEDEVFSVTPTLFDIDGNEQDITMTVTANMEYSIDSQPEWISKKSENSGTYTFTVGANTTSSARSGEIIFKNVNNSLLTVTVKQGIQTYTSSDYSQDGKVTKIHSATVGKGIDVVFVGDAFADKDQELFNKYVELGKEAFFTEEPFKSTKDRFNIYRIGSVSKNGIITQEGGDTKFSAEFGQGTSIGGEDEAVFSFVKKYIPSVDLTKTIVFVIINKAKYAGTCWMYSNNQAICYVPLCRNETDYAQTLRHEGCGHGFGKLADEYFYTSQGTIPADRITELKMWKLLSYGFYENVDLTSDPEKIAWSKFISDSRYSGKVGVYEGGYTYVYGVYRPTDYSIMRHNTGGFNAPSREAIYKKIMKFSEGDAWKFDYETFVKFDAPARSAEAVTRAAAQNAAVDEANFIPLAPPVMVMVDE